MIKHTMFAVYNVREKKFLPPVQRYKGATTRRLSTTPRLFAEKKHAKAAAKWWASGIARWVETEKSGYVGIDTTLKVRNRHLEDLRIVPVIVSIDTSSGETIA